VAPAAAPAFAFMVLVTVFQGDPEARICSMPMDVAWNGMTTMYLLMCAAHLPPWLRHLSGQRSA
jgi:hypothetical protein